LREISLEQSKEVDKASAFAHKKLVNNNNNNAYSSFVFFVDSHSREKEGL